MIQPGLQLVEKEHFAKLNTVSYTHLVFLAEPISNFIGGAACYLTMLLTIWREMVRKEREKAIAV